jgi:hypothetical protein
MYSIVPSPVKIREKRVTANLFITIVSGWTCESVQRKYKRRLSCTSLQYSLISRYTLMVRFIPPNLFMHAVCNASLQYSSCIMLHDSIMIYVADCTGIQQEIVYNRMKEE